MLFVISNGPGTCRVEEWLLELFHSDKCWRQFEYSKKENIGRCVQMIQPWLEDK